MTIPVHTQARPVTPPPLDARPAHAQPLVDAQNPWPGLLSFPEEAERFFNGRDTERDELLRLVRRDTLTVLYGQSGLGKSSLLMAGLFPVLRRERFLPVYVRLDHGQDSPPHDEQLRTALEAACNEHGIRGPEPRAGETTWELLHRSEGFWDAKYYPFTPVLVIDQFEEIFTLGAAGPTQKARSRTFLKQLADLIDNNPPADLLGRLTTEPGASSGFAFSEADYKIILSLREDYLPDLRQLRAYTSSPMQNELRLLRMRGDVAEQAVNETGGKLIAPEAAAAIVRAVARAMKPRATSGVESVPAADADDQVPLKTLEVEPALLSVVCSQLNERRKADGAPTITATLAEETRDEILEDFYNRSFHGLSPAVRKFVEDKLLTESGYHRNFAAQEDALAQGVPQGDINTLVQRRLLRVEERFDTKRVEITHDVLTQFARVSRDRRRAQEKRRADQIAAAARRRRQVAAAAVLLLLMAATAAWARSTARQAERNAKAQVSIAAARDSIRMGRDSIKAERAKVQAARDSILARDSMLALQDSTLLQREAALQDSAVELDRQRQALDVQTTQTRVARDAAERSERASQVGAEAAQHYRSVTGLLLERRTAVDANMVRLNASLKSQEAILARADSIRESGLARARALEAAYCQAIQGNSELRDRIDKNLAGAGGGLNCDGRQGTNQQPRQAQ
jgi:hypothetical protein